MIKVAGVKYENTIEDGGENRQEILKRFLESGQDIITVDLCYMARNDGTFGIKLKEHETKEVIGWMHSETADNMTKKNLGCMTGFIGYHGSYHVKLDDIKKPDDTEYEELCTLCEKLNYTKPVYDKRACEKYNMEGLKKLLTKAEEV